MNTNIVWCLGILNTVENKQNASFMVNCSMIVSPDLQTGISLYKKKR